MQPFTLLLKYRNMVMYPNQEKKEIITNEKRNEVLSIEHHEYLYINPKRMVEVKRTLKVEKN